MGPRAIAASNYVKTSDGTKEAVLFISAIYTQEGSTTLGLVQGMACKTFIESDGFQIGYL